MLYHEYDDPEQEDDNNDDTKDVNRVLGVDAT